MIIEISDLLKKIVAAEAYQLETLQIKHAPTIGAMYEKLTEKVLRQSMPPGIDLQVTNGFITHRDDYQPTTGQIDCMLVRGEGRRIGDLDSHIWHVRDVIAVLEVKKSLFATGLEDAFDQLRGVADTYDEWVRAEALATRNIEPALRAFADISGELAPAREDLTTLSPLLQMLYHGLIAEQDAPIRIALGYDGFSSEFGLRRGYQKFIEKNQGKKGFGVRSLPDLIIVGSSCLVKLNGRPYSSKIEEGWWPVLASGAGNPLRFMLEFIWTRLLREALVSSEDWFGNDLSVEVFVKFLEAQIVLDQSDAPMGWNYRTNDLKGKFLKERAVEAEWEPTVLTDAQHAVCVELLKKDIDTASSDFLSFGDDHGGARELADSLVATGLVARQGTWLVLTTKKAETMILPDGRFIIAENATGQLSRWIMRYLHRRRVPSPFE